MLSLSGAPPGVRLFPEAGQLRISIERRRSAGPVLFLLMGSGMGLASWSTGGALGRETWSVAWALLAVWLVAFTMGSLTVAALVALLLLGRERSPSPGPIAHRRARRPVSTERAFDLDGVRNLRVVPHMRTAKGRGLTRPALGALAFEHGGRTIRFAAGIRGVEADRVLAAIAGRLPAR